MYAESATGATQLHMRQRLGNSREEEAPHISADLRGPCSLFRSSTAAANRSSRALPPARLRGCGASGSGSGSASMPYTRRARGVPNVVSWAFRTPEGPVVYETTQQQTKGLVSLRLEREKAVDIILGQTEDSTDLTIRRVIIIVQDTGEIQFLCPAQILEPGDVIMVTDHF